MARTLGQVDNDLTSLEGIVASLNNVTHAELVQKMVNLLTSWQTREDQFRAWLVGTATGGPNSDGKYPLSDSTGFVKLVACPERIAVDANSHLIVEKNGPGQFIMAAGDVSKAHRIANGTAIATINVRLPNLPAGSQFMFIQGGPGPLNFSGINGATISHRQNHTRTAGRNAVAAAICDTFVGGISNWILAGDTVSA